MRAILLVAALTPALLGQVPYERIRASEGEPGNWLTYSGNYQGHRYSALVQINSTNVARLRPENRSGASRPAARSSPIRSAF